MGENTVKHCPACGGMLECKLENFLIGADGGGGLLSLLADQYEVDLYACPACGKVELYTANFSVKDEPPEQTVTCPVCGSQHSPLIGCPTCAMRGARSIPPPSIDSSPHPKRRKPPWEK
ncbi:MAG: hypothetical protein VB071_10360 [Lawsonibacter sp.]|nr:hypothetical protein [Lawsonibacter sp.]